MNEFIEKLIGRLEEKENEAVLKAPNTSDISNIEYQKWMMKSYGFKESIEIVNQLAEEYNGGWIPCSKQLPPHSDDLLLIQCSGKPKNNIVFNNAFCLASYTKEGWLLELYPEWKGAEVIAWQPLPEPYQPKGE